MPSIRPVSVDDCVAVAEIYRHYVENSTASFDHHALSEAEWQVKAAAIVDAGRPFLILENSDDPSLPSGVLGYAYLGVYRGKAGWAHTAEDSIYLRPEAAGRGLGRRLLQALVDATDAAVTRNIVAVISEEVPGSVALHRKVGFVEVGRMPAVGRKFDRWIGAVYMQFVVDAAPSEASTAPSA
ncbi:GNAT family N-acetyltransferase [Gordonia sp. (in: high G+C Gram-positive bacteria)]|uniref:GNAT family N-acetyltransferase n=1 Tax=Gordonia sp. (in: high G+C Gram-positive bacteria) TaxID=84139 RepID=UPI001690B184|nr:GNAT family N-acetyltransferase [Gordonia sp. (in: high G+C Gram-positive bacteria)]NLG47974.1 N-acetyltransferase [Gordonia sp. (in: high G+C Gram-positive bacteria)]